MELAELIFKKLSPYYLNIRILSLSRIENIVKVNIAYNSRPHSYRCFDIIEFKIIEYKGFFGKEKIKLEVIKII